MAYTKTPLATNPHIISPNESQTSLTIKLQSRRRVMDQPCASQRSSRGISSARRIESTARRTFERSLFPLKISDAIEAKISVTVEFAQDQFIFLLMDDVAVVGALFTLAGLIKERDARHAVVLSDSSSCKWPVTST